MLLLLNIKSPVHDSSLQSDENMVYICTFVFSWLVFNYPQRKNSQDVSCSPSLLTAKTGTSETDRIGYDPFESFINVDRICF